MHDRLVSDECTCPSCFPPLGAPLPPLACTELIVIAFTGKAGAGKSTCADHLISKHGFVRIKFASALKAMLRTFLAYRGAPSDAVEAMMEGHLKEVPAPWLNGRTPRHAMQYLGTSWGRELIDENLWVDTERDHLPKSGRFVCDDCRFPNEAAMIRSVGGKIVQVVRPSGFLIASAGHESEAHALEPDYMLINTGTIVDLRGDLDRLLHSEF